MRLCSFALLCAATAQQQRLDAQRGASPGGRRPPPSRKDLTLHEKQTLLARGRKHRMKYSPSLHAAANHRLVLRNITPTRFDRGWDAATVRAAPNRTLCSRGHVLPSLLLLGCMKCATTLLHRLVVKTCPQSVTQGRAFRDESWFRVKEKHYYDRDESEANDLKTYVSHFPRCPRSRKVLGIDSTQAYLKTPAAAPRAAATFGVNADAARLVVVLRDPSARLLSNYHHRRKSGELVNESTFEGYALRQLDEAAACGDGPLWGRCGFRPTDGLWVGLYAEQLAHWLVGFAAPSFTLLPFSEVTGNQTRALRALLGAVGLACKATATPLPKTNQKTRRAASRGHGRCRAEHRRNIGPATRPSTTRRRRRRSPRSTRRGATRSCGSSTARGSASSSRTPTTRRPSSPTTRAPPSPARGHTSVC